MKFRSWIPWCWKAYLQWSSTKTFRDHQKTKVLGCLICLQLSQSRLKAATSELNPESESLKSYIATWFQHPLQRKGHYPRSATENMSFLSKMTTTDWENSGGLISLIVETWKYNMLFQEGNQGSVMFRYSSIHKNSRQRLKETVANDHWKPREDKYMPQQKLNAMPWGGLIHHFCKICFQNHFSL